jgi:hypothetical protein
MEGKELYSNEDEELNPQSKKEYEDADDFGLPEIEDSEKDQEQLGDPYSDTSSDDYASDTTESSDNDYSYNEEDDKSSNIEEQPSYYEEDEEEQGKSPVVWIILIVVLMIVVLGAAYWWWTKEPAPEPVVEKPAIELPVAEPEPEIIEPEPEPAQQAGVYDLSELTGNYHVIVASSIDVDLVRDYANKLAKQGMVCNILAPRGNKMFHRLSVADFASLNDATLESERLKGTLGEDVWVIRY